MMFHYINGIGKIKTKSDCFCEYLEHRVVIKQCQIAYISENNR